MARAGGVRGTVGGATSLGVVTVALEWPDGKPLHCPACGDVAVGCGARPRRWRHLSTMQWKTLIE